MTQREQQQHVQYNTPQSTKILTRTLPLDKAAAMKQRRIQKHKKEKKKRKTGHVKVLFIFQMYMTPDKTWKTQQHDMRISANNLCVCQKRL